MSFHNVHDVSFVTANIDVDMSWIGLTTNRADGWQWSDSTAVQVWPLINLSDCISVFVVHELEKGRALKPG